MASDNLPFPELVSSQIRFILEIDDYQSSTSLECAFADHPADI